MRSVLSRQVRCRHHYRPHATRSSQHLRHGWRPPISPSPRIRTFGNINNALNSDPSFFSRDIDQGLTRPDQTQDAILDRAKAHGINTLDRLDIESDLGHVRESFRPRHISSAPRLLEDSSIRQDLDLWAVVLDYRRNKDGSHGVRDVLNAMLYGGKPVTLYDDAVSEHIWRTVLPVVLKDEKMLLEMCIAHSSFMNHRPSAFTDIVGQLMAVGNLRLAVILGTQYLRPHFRGRADLTHLFGIACKLGTDVALDNFCHIISRLPRHYMYGEILAKLWATGRVSHAFMLHRHLISLGDYPKDFTHIEPLVRELAARKAALEPFLHELNRCEISFSHQARQLYKYESSRIPSNSKSSNSRIVPGPGMRPVKLSDAFVARSFATKSVSFEFVLSGLRFIGLFEIGPLAVRELALAAGDMQTLRHRFEQLEKTEIDLGASNYVRVIKNLCFSGQDKLLQALLESDMHHDVFEDVQTQKRLLSSYYRKSDWPAFDRTLAILSGGKVNQETLSQSSTQFLQQALINNDWRGVTKTLDDMRNMAPQLRPASALAPLRLALRRIWAAYKPKHEMEYLDRYSYLVGFLQLAQSANLDVRLWQWRAVIHAVGRSGDWNLFQSLIFSVARMSFSSSQNVRHTSSDRHGSDVPLFDNLFDIEMQYFIIEIGLTARAKEQSPGNMWLRGVQLLCSLKRDFALDVGHDDIKAALEARILELFFSSEVGMLRRFTDHYVACMNWAWTEVSHGDEHVAHATHQRATKTPDSVSLKLFRLRSRHIRGRSHTIEPRLTGALDQRTAFEGESHTTAGESENFDVQDYAMIGDMGQMGTDFEEQDDSVVFYADLLHPSYKRSGNVKR